MLRLILFLLVVGVLLPVAAKAGEEAEREAFVQESRAMVKAFATALQGELKAAIEAGGPMGAIAVCNVRAPAIADGLSRSGQWSIGRTSHKLRNPDNAPDDWEAAGLTEFLERAAAGESLKTMERVALVEAAETQAYRYMKAIPVGEVCLACHGSDIDPQLAAEIGSFYPEDQATGFSLGELRGAFTVTKTLAE